MHAAAERSSVATTTAFAIVVERALIERDLKQRGLAQRARELDAIAARTTVKTPISDGLSEYLRVLYDHRAEVSASRSVRSSDIAGALARMQAALIPPSSGNQRLRGAMLAEQVERIGGQRRESH